MLDLNDFIIKETLRKNDYIDRYKKYKCSCESCGKDRGYQTKSRYKNKPKCVKCATNTKAHKATLVKNHWSKTQKYSPKKYKTKEEIASKREKELKWNREYYKAYYQANKQAIHERRKKYNKENTNARLASNLRTRLNLAVKNGYKSGSAVRDLGCSIKELKKYLEAQFKPGMNWNNWTRDGWHIDHIKPLSGFDLTDKDQFKEACHYTNLQPLWAKENLIKGNI